MSFVRLPNSTIEFLILQQQIAFVEAEDICKEFDDSATVGFINKVEESDFVIALANPLVVNRAEDGFLLMLGYNDPTEEGGRVTNKYVSVSEKANLAFFETEFIFPWFENAPFFEGENGACVYMVFGEFPADGQVDNVDFVGEWVDQSCDLDPSFLLCRRDIKLTLNDDEIIKNKLYLIVAGFLLLFLLIIEVLIRFKKAYLKLLAQFDKK